MLKRWAAIFFLLLMAGMFFVSCQPKEEETPYEEIPALNDAEEPGYRRTILYFEDENGYIIPVMKKIKMEEGIGKAALIQLRTTEAEPLRAYGLYPVLPDDAKIALSIKDKIATLDMNKKAYEAHNSYEEGNKVAALVNTLTEFNTIEKVQFLVDSKKISKLDFGTKISEPVTRSDINPETADKDIDVKSASKLTLYFEDQQGKHIVPVTRYVKGDTDVSKAIGELVLGPVDKMALVNAFPENTKLLEAKTDDKGVLNINFSKEFSAIANDQNMEASALKTLYLTCMAFDNIKDVNILVEGKEYEGTAAAMAVPEFANSFR